MATASRHLFRTLLPVSRSLPVKRKCLTRVTRHCQPQIVRPFASSTRRRADEPSSATSNAAADTESAPIETDPTPADVEPSIADAQSTTGEAESESTETASAAANADAAPDTQGTSDAAPAPKGTAAGDDLQLDDEEDGLSTDKSRYLMEAQAAIDSVEKVRTTPLGRLAPRDVGYWAEDEEDDEFAFQEDDDDDVDESHMTMVAENQLDGHREIRQYMRAIAWDMPLLNQYAKPFQVPTYATPLRFRYTTYMGEYHPAEKKVVVQFTTKDLAQSLSLSEDQRIKLIKLVGVRYNPSTDVVRMSSEKFEHAAQNKRYLGDLVDKLVATAKDPTDTFEDIPLDFRHHKEKKRPEFPENWKLTQRRVKELEILRQEPLRQLQAAEDVQEEEKVQQSAAQQRIAEYVMAMEATLNQPPNTSSRQP